MADRIRTPAARRAREGGNGPGGAPLRTESAQLALDPTITGPGRRTEDPYEPGTEVKIRGEQGTFKYRYASLSQAGRVSLHLVGEHGSRAARPNQVTPAKKTGGRR